MASVKSEIYVQSIEISMDEYMHMSTPLIKKLKIPTHRPLLLVFGSYRRSIQVMPVARSRKNFLRISARAAEALGLHDGDVLRVMYDKQAQAIRIGPAIGVLLPRGSSDLDRPFGNVTAFCRELHGASRIYGGIVYFFTPDGAASSEIEGWRFIYPRFKRMKLPVPDVVYNRLTTRKLENKDSVQHFFHNVKSRHHGHIFNEKFLDKNEVFSALAKNPSIQKHLPESRLFTRYEQLATMSKRYGSVFLKPVTGSLGKGIIRVSRTRSRILCQFANVNGAAHKIYPSISKAFPAIKSRVQGKRYLIQQGLRLITVQDRPVDFRALVQKNDRGRWTITSIVGRIASNQSFVSNVARGGTLCPARSALAASNLSSSRQASTLILLKKAAIAIAETLEDEIHAHLAELGIDLAVDQAGRVWLLEVNSKPSKNDGTPLSEGKIRPSVKKMLQYSRSISGM